VPEHGLLKCTDGTNRAKIFCAVSNFD